MDKQFKDLYKVGDFVVYRNMICIVTAYSDRIKKWIFDEPSPGYQVMPILNSNYLEIVFVIQEVDYSSLVSEEFLLHGLSCLVETTLEIDDIDVYISDTNIMLCQDEGYMSISPEQALQLRDLIENYVQDYYGN